MRQQIADDLGEVALIVDGAGQPVEIGAGAFLDHVAPQIDDPRAMRRRLEAGQPLAGDQRQRPGDQVVGGLGLLVLGLVFAALTGRVAGQQSDQGTPTFRSGVDLIQVDVTVLDKAGAPVPGLTAADFTVKINGKTQPVRTAAFVEAAPDRMIWGTDWPHTSIYEPGKMPNDGDLLDMLLDYAPDALTQRKILVETPERLFDFD